VRNETAGFTRFGALKAKIIFGYMVRAEQRRWLEYVTALPLRAPLAAPIGFDAPFCGQAKR
jgi:hypothetical protein